MNKNELIEKIIKERDSYYEVDSDDLRQILQDTLPDGKDTINQLNTLHRMELDAVACKSLKEFMKWVEERKSKKFTKDTLPSEQVVEITDYKQDNDFYCNWICPECGIKNTKKNCERCGYKIFNA